MLKRRVGNVSKKGRLTKRGVEKNIGRFVFFVCLSGFLSRTFTIHRTAVEGGDYFFNSSLPLPPASQTLGRMITAESSPLHIASS